MKFPYLEKLSKDINIYYWYKKYHTLINDLKIYKRFSKIFRTLKYQMLHWANFPVAKRRLTHKDDCHWGKNYCAVVDHVQKTFQHFDFSNVRNLEKQNDYKNRRFLEKYHIKERKKKTVSTISQVQDKLVIFTVKFSFIF